MYAQSFRVFVSITAAVSLACFLAGCGGGDEQSQAPSVNLPAGVNPVGEADPLAAAAMDPMSATPTADARREVKINLFPEVAFKTSEGNFTVKLNREKAPLTVENFLQNYVEKGYYDNTIFHQVEKGFMVLGGAFTPDLEAKPTRAQIYSEAHNEVKNVRGTIAMARDPAFEHTASNQFFFNLADNPDLDHVSRESTEDYGYCVFGEVTKGLEVLDRISEVQVENREGFPSLPVKTVLIESVRQLR